jgi:hypothetical protein
VQLSQAAFKLLGTRVELSTRRANSRHIKLLLQAIEWEECPSGMGLSKGLGAFSGIVAATNNAALCHLHVGHDDLDGREYDRLMLAWCN